MANVNRRWHSRKSKMLDSGSPPLRRSELAASVHQLVDRCVGNVARASNLIQAYRQENANRDPASSVESLFDDLFRASVVFLHAALEDFLRGIGRLRLPSANATVLDRIPLLQDQPSLEPRKYLLGELSRHRGSSVDDLISASIGQYLERRTFSSASEVVGYLCDLSIPVVSFEDLASDIDSMMKRRHRIVHQADHHTIEETNPSRLRFDDIKSFMGWLTAVQQFIIQMQYELLPPGERDETKAGVINGAKRRAEILLEVSKMADRAADGKDK